MTRLALVGYGKMGRLVESLAAEMGFEVALRLSGRDNAAGRGITAEAFRGVEAAIDFSTAAAVPANVERLLDLEIPVVVGTTGWQDDLPRLRERVLERGGALVHGANFSPGVLIFYRIVETAARLFAADPSYDPWLYEIHHRMKRDAPSGTLRELARALERAGYDRPVDTAASRAGAVPGTHPVGFDAAADTITLTHTARDRSGFARGALLAARWILGRRGFHSWQEVWEEAGKEPPREEIE
jgi:4-hydroxy-tetrahydrodipicolinate reductase